MSATAPSICEDCARPISGTVEGLCSRCLLLRALEPMAPEPVLPSPSLGSPVMRFFGDYELISEVARGGMGVVYRARQVRLDRLVALKVLAAGGHASPQFVERFQTEAKAAAALDHPHIVPIYEVGEVGGQSFFTMRLVEGGNLAAHVQSKGGHLSNAAAATILTKLARAVYFAHQHGVLHRDLKPGNVLIDSREEPLLTDFGLAKLVEYESTITLSHSMLGTPAYMSPEQAAGKTKTLTTASDVYGLGAILYELLTGAPPFTGATAIETARQVLEQEPRRPSSLNPSVDRDLEVICLKCLEKEPARRYGSAEALAEDLSRFIRREPIQARPVGLWERAGKWVRRHPRRAAMFGALALALLGLVVIPTVFNFRLREANRRAAMRAEENREQLVRFNVTRGINLMNQGDLAGSLPWLVKALQLDEGHPEKEQIHRVRLRAVLSQIPRLVRIFQAGTNLFTGQFNADGTRVLLHSRIDAFAQVFDIASGLPATPPMRHQAFVRGAAFDASGDRVVTVSYDQTAQIWDARTGQPAGPPLRHATSLISAAFTPDGLRVATGAMKGGLAIWDAASGAPILSTLAGETVNAVACSPDGTWIAAGLDRGIRLLNQKTGELSPLLESGMRFPMITTRFSTDSHRVLGTGGDGTLIWELPTFKALTPVLAHPTFWVYGSAFSPDGLSVISYGRDGMARVWGTSGQPATTPTLRHNHGVRFAEFSPDGLRIVTASDDHTACIWDASSGEPLCVLQHGNRLLMARFSADGRLVLTLDPKAVRVWDLAATSRGRQLLKVGRAHGLGFSSDRSQMLVADAERNVRLWDIASAKELPLPAASVHSPSPPLAFTQLPDRILHPSGQKEFRREDSAAIRRTSDQQKLTPPLNHREAMASANFSPDGRYILTTGVDRTARVWEVENGDAITPPLRSPSAVYHAIFDSESRQFAFLNETDFIEVLNLSPDPRPTADLEALGQLLSGKLITPLRLAEELDDGALLKIHRELSFKYPAEFSTSADERLRWHWREAALAPEGSGYAAFISRRINAEADPSLWRWRALMEVQGKDFTNALHSYSKTLEREPADAQLWRARGAVLQNLGRLDQAAADLTHAVELAPHDALPWRDRAICRLKRNEPEAALQDLNQAITLTPGSAELFELRGRAATLARQWDRAMADFAEARRVKRQMLDASGQNDVRGIPHRRASLPPGCLDLESYFTSAIFKGWFVPFEPGTEEGLSKLQLGTVELANSVFAIQGAAQLAGRESQMSFGTFPSALRGIRLPAGCRRIHFLHGMEGGVAFGTLVAKITVHFDNAPAAEIPVRYDEQVTELFSARKQSPRDPAASIVWTATAATRLPHQALTRLTWENPTVQARTVMLDYESTFARYAPALLAITVETDGESRAPGNPQSSTPSK